MPIRESDDLINIMATGMIGRFGKRARIVAAAQLNAAWNASGPAADSWLAIVHSIDEHLAQLPTDLIYGAPSEASAESFSRNLSLEGQHQKGQTC